ncbi:MAG: CapA family protein [Firmicutes bacterium]|nr:CapA family protein [Bacillota bacterium]
MVMALCFGLFSYQPDAIVYADCEEPGEVIEAGETTGPGETEEPGEGVDQGETEDPGEIEDPGDPTNPGETADPTDPTDPAQDNPEPVTQVDSLTPPATKLTRLSSSKKAIIVRWEQVSDRISGRRITGYHIQVATNKAFTNNKKNNWFKGYKITEKKVKGLLDKKTYYVRIRTYVTVDGRRHYSKWSDAQRIKTDRVRYTESSASLVSKYTIKYPDTDPVERSTPYFKETIKSKYKYGKDGYYHLKKSTAKNTCKLIFTGDLMCRLFQQRTALDKFGEYRFNESFHYLKSRFEKADLVVGNLETVLSSRSPYMSEKRYVDKLPNVNAPATYLSALRYAGYDALVMANNHNCDCGVYGILDTLDNVEDYKFIHTGTFAEKDQDRYVLIEVNGIKIALMSFATYYNDKDKMITQDGRDLLLNRYSKAKVRKLVKKARKKGAEFIIAYNHWGSQFTYDVRSSQRKYARQMANCGVDYIIGSHTHCLQHYEVIKAKDGRKVPVVYSMGNFISDMPEEITRDNIYLKVKLGRNKKGKVVVKDEEYVPCYIFDEYQGRNYAVVPLVKRNAEPMADAFFKDSRARIKSVIGKKPDMCKY